MGWVTDLEVRRQCASAGYRTGKICCLRYCGTGCTSTADRSSKCNGITSKRCSDRIVCTTRTDRNRTSRGRRVAENIVDPQPIARSPRPKINSGQAKGQYAYVGGLFGSSTAGALNRSRTVDPGNADRQPALGYASGYVDADRVVTNPAITSRISRRGEPIARLCRVGGDRNRKSAGGSARRNQRFAEVSTTG